ncbi:hypothetical protein [Leifsonia sp. NPDC058230]|uniref:hypothetical protein n=1 Tax=Leifsonia sp. NPDC058230 TaxID=3346391 RepID=UPI0036DF68B4
MTLDGLQAMITDANGSWAKMEIWEDYRGEPPIAHKALSMALELLHDDEPRFVHLRATSDAPDFELLIFTDDRIVSVEYDGEANNPVGRTISRRSISRLDLRSVNVTTMPQHGSSQQPLTYLVEYADLSLTLTTADVPVRERREAISALFPTVLNDWETRRFERG